MRLTGVLLLALALLPTVSEAATRLIAVNGAAFSAMGSHGAQELDARFGSPARQTAQWVGALEPGVPIVAGSTTLVPLVSAQGAANAAIAPGACREPLSGPDTGAWTLDLTNAEGQPRFALLGQILEGPYTQDRFVERSFLVEPTGSAPATIFCCEERYQAIAEQPLFLTRYLAPADLRARMLADFQAFAFSIPEAAVTHRWTEKDDRSNETQRLLWQEIAARLAAAGIQSPYGAYMDLVRAQRRWIAEPNLPADTCGIAFGVGSELVSVECLPSAAQFRETGAQQIVASHLATSLATSTAPADPSAVITAWNALRTSFPTPRAYLVDPSGDVTLHFADRRSAGAVLTREGAPVHLFFSLP